MPDKNNRMCIGSASVILVLVVFALTVFAVLSIRTSYHEYKMSEKTRDAVTEYYTADSKAEKLLAKLSGILYNYNTQNKKADLEQEFEKIDEVTNVSLEEGTLNYEIPVNKASFLDVELDFNLSSNNPYFIIHSWKVVSSNQDESDGQIELDEPDEKPWDDTISE